MDSESPGGVILLAEDDDDDFLMVSDALVESGLNHQLRRVVDGEALMDYLRRQGAFTDPAAAPAPHLVLLDLNMPIKDGRECLRDIRADHRLRHLPVVVLSTSSDAEDVNASYRLGANAYLQKPVDFGDYVEMMQSLGAFWFATAKLPANP